jgi:predicted DNA-binding transcriptional regulator AlpA
MAELFPIAVGEKSAAKMFDMDVRQFRDLVRKGVLPRPRQIGSFDRWDAEELRAVVRGQMVHGYEDVKW